MQHVFNFQCQSNETTGKKVLHHSKVMHYLDQSNAPYGCNREWHTDNPTDDFTVGTWASTLAVETRTHENI